jgi:hypothetical protein
LIEHNLSLSWQARPVIRAATDRLTMSKSGPNNGHKPPPNDCVMQCQAIVPDC